MSKIVKSGPFLDQERETTATRVASQGLSATVVQTIMHHAPLNQRPRRDRPRVTGDRDRDP
ncbi:hypothetical protein HETIRDRAFT_452498 [Heterobasidion irregulare TC 32-1]|uniref:Uncharacterized protein n=1 Tax=Heterobasidion irregulare (strain TC 32-1) TaxID=747525 RepID=W4K7L0_HETIT|nr:uncharacterized protein HETIRDRAFT_452498 [Heterobasidion irregulare TC 32-1]ETW81061.1 hypothetical protein HETIRDRAFT_452498 [Heterobasidion irregulare TC 32-1]